MDQEKRSMKTYTIVHLRVQKRGKSKRKEEGKKKRPATEIGGEPAGC